MQSSLLYIININVMVINDGFSVKLKNQRQTYIYNQLGRNEIESNVYEQIRIYTFLSFFYTLHVNVAMLNELNSFFK